MTSPYRAWLIDLDGTLYAPKMVKLAMGAELLLFGAHQASLLSRFRKNHEILHHEQAKDPQVQFLPSPFAEQIRRTAEQTGVPKARVRRAVEQWMLERPGKWIRRAARKELLERIREFRAAGGKTALVTDYPAQKKLKALSITDLFDVVVASGEEPRLTRLKPSPDGYLLAAEKLGVTPSECLVLGDRDDADGAAARAAEMDFELVG